jgi:epoxide hydrolase
VRTVGIVAALNAPPTKGQPVSHGAVRPFTVQIPDTDLEDLRSRLRNVRWPDELADAAWDYGVPRRYVKELAAYWRDGYDWRAHEARLNQQSQFVTKIDGEQVHFLHVRSPEPDALPLICTHGWPMSVFEYLDLLGPLGDPRAHSGDPIDAFHLVVPSIPGVTFSGPTAGRGWNTARIARAWVTLMGRLGYERYGAHGNDLGSQVSPEVGRHDPERVVGVHVTQLFSFPSGDPAELADLSREDQAALAFLEQFSSAGGLAYNQYQSAQPQTLAYALQDSPAGWLAWISQLFRNAVDRDAIITDAAAIGSPARSARRSGATTRMPTRPSTPRSRRRRRPEWRSSLRLSVDPQIRRPRPRQHHQLEPPRHRQPLRHARRDRPADLGHSQHLPAPALATAGRGSNDEGESTSDEVRHPMPFDQPNDCSEPRRAGGHGRMGPVGRRLRRR